jgi:hypothetical protein
MGLWARSAFRGRRWRRVVRDRSGRHLRRLRDVKWLVLVTLGDAGDEYAERDADDDYQQQDAALSGQ